MRAIQTYQRSRVESAPNEDILVMLVEAALQREDAAIAAMERADRAGWIHEIHVARAIFIELRQALDHADAPEVAANIDRTYRWCIHHLTVAARTGDAARMKEIRRVTEVLHTMWTQAVDLTRQAPADSDASRGTAA